MFQHYGKSHSHTVSLESEPVSDTDLCGLNWKGQREEGGEYHHTAQEALRQGRNRPIACGEISHMIIMCHIT